MTASRQIRLFAAALAASLAVHVLAFVLAGKHGLPVPSGLRQAMSASSGKTAVKAAPARPLRLQTVDVRDLVFRRGNAASTRPVGPGVDGAAAQQQVRDLFAKLDLLPKPLPQARITGLGQNVIAPKPLAAVLPAAPAAPPVKILEVDTARLAPGRLSPDRPLTPKISRVEAVGDRLPGLSGAGSGQAAGEPVNLSMRLGSAPVIPLRPADLQSLQGTSLPLIPEGGMSPASALLGAGLAAGRLEGFVTVSISVYEAPEQGGFFRVDIAPNPAIAKFGTVDKDLLFLVDCSASITATKLEQFKQGVQEVLKELRPQDRFNVVAFRDEPQTLFPDVVSVTPENTAAAARFVTGQERGGLTDVYRGLSPFVRQAAAVPAAYRPMNVFLLSDGRSTVRGKLDNDTFIREVVKLRQPHISVYSFSAGEGANLFLMDMLAYSNRGLSLYEQSVGRFAPELVQFIRNHADIMVADLRWNATGGLAYDIYPKQLPHLYRNETLSLYGRYPPGAEKLGLQIIGRDAAGREQELVFSADVRQAPRAGAQIAKDWACQKIFHLLEARVLKPDPRQQEEIRRLAETYKIYVPYL